jgi:cytochrome c-type biogenesis protein CcmH/NrfG
LWEEAVEEVPGSVRAWTNLGAARLAGGRPALAAAAFRRALALDPARADLRSSLHTAELLAAGHDGGLDP